MLTIGIEPHKQTHTAVAVDRLGVPVTQRTVATGVRGSVSCWSGLANWTANVRG